MESTEQNPTENKKQSICFNWEREKSNSPPWSLAIMAVLGRGKITGKKDKLWKARV